MLLHWRRHDSVRAVELLGDNNAFRLHKPSGLALPPLSFDPRAATPRRTRTGCTPPTNSRSSTPRPSIGRRSLKNSTAREACAANGTTGGLGTSSPGQRASSGVNPIWSAAATLLGRDIGSSAAWNSELFDVHRVRIDLEQTLDDICRWAHRIWRARGRRRAPAARSARRACVGIRVRRRCCSRGCAACGPATGAGCRSVRVPRPG